MLQFGVLADDLTGAMIVGSLLEREGIRCPVVTDADELDRLPADARAVVLARKIRLVDPTVARAEARRAGEAFVRHGVPVVYSKYSALFDNKREGTIGPIAEELLAATGATQTIFCPAYVERRLTVYQGHLFVRNVPLDRSFKRHDPSSPAWSADLTEVLRAHSPGVEVGLLAHDVVARGVDAIDAAMARQPNVRFFVADAIDDTDIAHLAAAGARWKVVTGGDSLAPALARAVVPDAVPVSADRVQLLPPAGGHSAVLAGSCAEPTRAQLDAFAARHPGSLWRVALVEEGHASDLAERIAAWAAPRLADGPVAVSTSADPEGVAAAHARYGLEGASALADRLLGDVARRLHSLGVRRFVVAGGETAGEILGALGVGQVDVAPFDDMFGGYCHRRGDDPLSFVVKPGSFGESDFFFRALDRMAAADAALLDGSDRHAR